MTVRVRLLQDGCFFMILLRYRSCSYSIFFGYYCSKAKEMAGESRSGF